MLVMQRRKGEGARIGDTIFVRVLEIGQKRVKLGIEAPADLRVVRDELPSLDKQRALRTTADDP